MTRNGNPDVLRLDRARQQTPPVEPIEAMRNQLQLALFGAITEMDLIGVMKKLKEKALAGDLQAMKLLFGLIDRKAAPAQLVQVDKAVVLTQPAEPQTQPVPQPPINPLHELRRLAAGHIGSHGPASPRQLADALGCQKETIGRVLDCDWFEREPDGYHLTAVGNAVARGEMVETTEDP